MKRASLSPCCNDFPRASYWPGQPTYAVHQSPKRSVDLRCPPVVYINLLSPHSLIVHLATGRVSIFSTEWGSVVERVVGILWSTSLAVHQEHLTENHMVRRYFLETTNYSSSSLLEYLLFWIWSSVKAIHPSFIRRGRINQMYWSIWLCTSASCRMSAVCAESVFPQPKLLRAASNQAFKDINHQYEASQCKLI